MNKMGGMYRKNQTLRKMSGSTVYYYSIGHSNVMQVSNLDTTKQKKTHKAGSMIDDVSRTDGRWQIDKLPIDLALIHKFDFPTR